MSYDDPFIGQLEDYLEAFDDATPLPDRVRDAIRAELPSARQVRPRTGPLRVFTMLSNASARARVGLAAAAIVAAVVLGAAFLNNRNEGVGGNPAPVPTPTMAPTVAPSIAAGPVALGSAPVAPCDATDTLPNTCVAPGTYRLNDAVGPGTWPVTVTVDVPTGWFNWQAGAGVDGVLVDGGPQNRGNSGWGVLFATVADVARDPCNPSKGVTPAAQVSTPQRLAAAMAAWPSFKATTPEPITVDGHTGLKLQLTSTGPSACNSSGWLWRTTAGDRMDVYPMIGGTDARAPGTFEIVDTGHGLLVIRTTDFPQTSPNELDAGMPMDQARHASDLGALQEILDSIRITPLPTAP